jgi:hypothetical protein
LLIREKACRQQAHQLMLANKFPPPHIFHESIITCFEMRKIFAKMKINFYKRAKFEKCLGNSIKAF